MSWFVGAVALKRGVDNWRAPFLDQLSTIRAHYPSIGDWRSADTGDFVILKASVNAYADFGMRTLSRGVTALTGEALLPGSLALPSEERRSWEAAEILGALCDDRWQSLLRRSRGSFASIAYDAIDHRALLSTDRLGIRPIYWHVGRDALYFGTSFPDLLATLPGRQSVDLQGFAELLAFNCAFGDRTGLAAVRVLRPGGALVVSDGEYGETAYYDLRDETHPAMDAPYDPDNIYSTFREAVRIRADGHRSVASFLSGGLDSRTICAILRSLGLDVATATLSSPTSLDTYCGIRAAEILGTRHRVLDFSTSTGGAKYSKVAVQEWIASLEADGVVERPRLIWSGDGGSVGLGCVYMTEESCEMANRGDLIGAMKASTPPITYLKGLRSALREEIGTRMELGLRQEADSMANMRGEKALYLYLMRNDQRRHLFRHFNDVLNSGFDLQLPIFDAELIAAMVRQPTARYLFHRGYMEMLESNAPECLAAPFQAYPNHVPSPVPCPTDRSYQWAGASDRIFSNRLRQRTLALYVDCLKSYPSIADIVSLPALLSGLVMQYLSSRDYGYRARGAAILKGLRAIP